MIEADNFENIKEGINSCIDISLLDELRRKIRPLRKGTRRILPRTTTTISIVATDGDTSRIKFDPFQISVLRVVDSLEELSMDIVSPSVDIADLDRRHIGADGVGRTPLGKMMNRLGNTRSIRELSSTLSPDDSSWPQVYGELMEWAVLLDLASAKHASDVVILRDGFLRSKAFTEPKFERYHQVLKDAIDAQFKEHRRRVYLVGIARRSKLLQYYGLAMAIEGVLRNAYPSYVAVPTEFAEDVYKWKEYAEGRMVAGKMFFVKFGPRPQDRVWAADIFQPQADQSPAIFGYLLGDALNGFPVPYYPLCLQRAREQAELLDFDFGVLQDQISDCIRSGLGSKRHLVDEFELQEDLADARNDQ